MTRLRRAVAVTCAALMLVPTTAAARTLVGPPGKDRLRGGDFGSVIQRDAAATA